MHRILIQSTAVLLIFFLWSPSSALDMFPLEPPNTSSPRRTMESFLKYSEMFYKEMRASEPDEAVLDEARDRAERCFDLSQVAPSIREDVALESVLRLREVLDRIPYPVLSDIPGKELVEQKDIHVWRMPHTEIKIGRAQEDRLGAYLFTPETVDRLDEFYADVEEMPYKDGATEGVYEAYLYASGWLIPDGLIGMLPAWMHVPYYGQTAWQWGSLGLIVVIACLLLWPLYLWHRTQRHKRWELSRLVFPVMGMFLSVSVEYLVSTQVNITGKVMAMVTMGLESVLTVFAAWAILVAGNVFTHIVVAAQDIKEEALNADVIKLICRLVSLSLVFALFYRVGSYFGLPVTAVFASAGIAGVAVALAARETLANFFGGISIFMDRPFRAGDYVVLDSGERGAVKAVGMRSTRLLTRDDVLITIPNSIITNIKIVNQSAPSANMRLRIKTCVAYGTDLDVAEELLRGVAVDNPLVMDDPEPRVRLRSLAESGIAYELLVWVARPHERGLLTHELNREICSRFKTAGIKIPFPQRSVHIHDERSNAAKR